MLKFICPDCGEQTEDVPTGDHVLKDGYMLECSECYRITRVAFLIDEPPNNRLHLTAFGAGGRGDNPLQSSEFTEVLPATHGGK